LEEGKGRTKFPNFSKLPNSEGKDGITELTEFWTGLTRLTGLAEGELDRRKMRDMRGTVETAVRRTIDRLSGRG
jgi:hypothetical protein